MTGIQRVVSPETTFQFDGRAGSTQEISVGPLIDTVGWGSATVLVRFYSIVGSVWDSSSRLSIVARNAFKSFESPLPLYSADIAAERFGSSAAGTLIVMSIPDLGVLGDGIQLFLRWEQGPNTNPQGGPILAQLGIDVVGKPRSVTTPTSLPNLALWLRGDRATISTGHVTSWTDLSGNGRHATTPANATTPIWGETTLGLNARPSLVFNGNTALISTPSFAVGTYTIFTVFRASGTGGIIYEHSPDVNTNDGCGLLTTTGTTSFVRRGGVVSSKNYTTNWGVDNVGRIVRQEFDGTNVSNQLALNGFQASLSTVSGGDPGVGTTTQQLFIGGRSSLVFMSSCAIAELLVFTPKLSGAMATALERAYLSPRYGIPVQ